MSTLKLGEQGTGKNSGCLLVPPLPSCPFTSEPVLSSVKRVVVRTKPKRGCSALWCVTHTGLINGKPYAGNCKSSLEK